MSGLETGMSGRTVTENCLIAAMFFNIGEGLYENMLPVDNVKIIKIHRCANCSNLDESSLTKPKHVKG